MEQRVLKIFYFVVGINLVLSSLTVLVYEPYNYITEIIECFKSFSLSCGVYFLIAVTLNCLKKIAKIMFLFCLTLAMLYLAIWTMIGSFMYKGTLFFIIPFYISAICAILVFVISWLKKEYKEDSSDRKRILAFFIDMLIFSVLNIVLIIIFVLDPDSPADLFFGKWYDYDLCFFSFEVYLQKLFIVHIISFCFFILKDIFSKCSIGKILMHQKIVCKKTVKDASFIQKIIRNLFLTIWLVEIIFYLINKKRIGDVVAGTEVTQV